MVWVGLIGLAVAVVCGYLAWVANTRIRSMESTETLSVSDLRALRSAAVEAAGEGQFRYRCEVVGAAREHKNGALSSELEKVDCVWHKHKVTHKYEEITRDSKGRRQRRTRSEVVSQHSSPTAFFVEDATGKVVIRPGKHDVIGAEKVLDRFEQHHGDRGGQLKIGPLTLGSSRGGTIGYKHEEWVVRSGRQLFIHGEASDAGGGLSIGAPAEGGVFIMSTKPQDELIRGENNKLLGFGIGAGAAALTGVVFLILSFLS
ncbi:E3 ubiquitin ligase family protein [Streptomyces gobiensis]|uniref:E3 ubiquitin ligase family protein n=1 Tax=Streptomyces gobiensis TaxID=2875706 RepID=UPI001E4444BD|nr:E3 ubiquitin ligase family protein [Streptomyces gobiensis]UGY93666.1 E3 ubiquitin ligase family protein [Streptomyces gobiensis]